MRVRTIESLRLSFALRMIIYQVYTRVNTLHLGFIEFYSEIEDETKTMRFIIVFKMQLARFTSRYS